MAIEKAASQISTSTQAARELAYRRWRPQTAAAAEGAGASPARLLAYRRWGTAPAQTPAAVPSGDSTGTNAVILAALVGFAFAIYGARKKSAPPSAGDQENWQTWLVGGSVVLAAALLLFSNGARRNLGLILGVEAVLLAAASPM